MTKKLPLLVQPPAQREIPAPPRRLRMAMVNMPWSWVDAPSIQCGLLQSIVRKAGHDCDVLYLNIDLAAVLGSEIYNRVAEMNDDRFHQLGEWLFSYSAFGDIRPEQDYLDEYPEVARNWSEFLDDGLERLIGYRRELLPAWVRDQVDAVDWTAYDVVGFSSTFMQNTASLALGKLLKQRYPDLPLVFGGANFDGEMGVAYADGLGWLDYVVAGEGDIALPALLFELAAGTDNPIPGVHRIDKPGDPQTETERTYDLDVLPVPDYHDYFTRLNGSDREQVLGENRVRLPVEFSRGCWWGEKHHCTFCGLNNLGINFRAKSGPRAFADLEELLAAYPITQIDAVDNILDMKYLTSFCTELAERHWDIDLFYEVKANLTREQLLMMKRAGIYRIQPGIESLSTHVLGLMRKGATKLINIRLLKWARYYGISTEWHVLCGFPGETDRDYAEQAALLPLLSHLQPPASQIGIWLERFSPYFTDPSFGITGIRPQASYQYVYPPDLDHRKIAYFFDFDPRDTASAEAHATMREAVATWQRKWATDGPPTLYYEQLPGRVSIIDGRSRPVRRLTLEGWHGRAYVACGDTARSRKRIHQQFLDDGLDLSLQTVTDFLDECCRIGVMVSEDDLYLALALPENPHW